MALGLVGKKSGMTRIFNDEGVSVPVTVIEAEPNRITQVKSKETDGYSAIQVTTGERRLSRVSKPMAGHFAKASSGAGRGLWEFRAAQTDGLDVGGELTVEQFAAGQQVDVQGVSKGKGFAGTIKRWISEAKILLMATQFPTARQDPLANAKHRAVFLRAKKCPVRWVMSG